MLKSGKQIRSWTNSSIPAGQINLPLKSVTRKSSTIIGFGHDIAIKWNPSRKSSSPQNPYFRTKWSTKTWLSKMWCSKSKLPTPGTTYLGSRKVHFCRKSTVKADEVETRREKSSTQGQSQFWCKLARQRKAWNEAKNGAQTPPKVLGQSLVVWELPRPQSDRECVVDHEGEPRSAEVGRQPGPARATAEKGLVRNIRGHAAQPGRQNVITHPEMLPTSRRLCWLSNKSATACIKCLKYSDTDVAILLGHPVFRFF